MAGSSSATAATAAQGLQRAPLNPRKRAIDCHPPRSSQMAVRSSHNPVMSFPPKPQSFIMSQLLCFLMLFFALSAGQQIAQPGGPEDIIITAKDTLNSTGDSSAAPVAVAQKNTAGQLDLSFINNLASNNVNAYVTGLDPNGRVVLLQANGNWYYPPSTSSGVPQTINADVSIPLGPPGSTTNITLPTYLSSGRVWLADGTLEFFVVAGGTGVGLVQPSAANPSDPNAATNWGFVELTNIANGGLYANLSFVDFVGMALGMTITAVDGAVQSALGLPSTAVASVCKKLIAQAKADGQPWDDLCITGPNGQPLRVLAPALYLSTSASAFKGYWDDYVDQVWSYYSTRPLTIDMQTSPGLVNCTVTGSTLNCAGDNRGYPQPNALDIFGCNSGPFAIQGGDNLVHYAVVPRLCAAFDRTTLLLPGGNLQPSLDPSYYYSDAPTNWYSYWVHENEVDGKGYAFSYDDVTPSGQQDQSGLLAMQNPSLMQIFVGGAQAAVVNPSSSTSTLSKSATSKPVVSASASSSMFSVATPTPASTTKAMTTSKSTTAKKTTTTTTLVMPTCNSKYIAAIKKAHPKTPQRFCQNYKPRQGVTKSPIKGIGSAQLVVRACKCFIKQQAVVSALAKKKIALAKAKSAKKRAAAAIKAKKQHYKAH